VADQLQVLRILVAHGDPMAVTEIAKKIVPFSGDRAKLRKGIIAALGGLQQRKLVTRAAELPVFPANANARFEASDAGRAFVKSGQDITTGPRGNLTGVRVHSEDTFRASLWRALRQLKRASTIDLIELARDVKRDGKGDLRANALRYLRALERAGVVIQMKQKAVGHAPTSNGFLRFSLINDLGPIAPVASKKGLLDRNANEVIHYSEAK